MCARFTVLSDTPIAAAIAGWAIPLSRNNTIWMRWRCAAGILPAQRSFQPPHLGFAAFDHLFSPNQMAQANHTSGEENSPRLSAKNPDSSRYGGSIRIALKSANDPPARPCFQFLHLGPNSAYASFGYQQSGRISLVSLALSLTAFEPKRFA